MDFIKDMIAKSHDLYNEGSEEPSTTDGVIKLVKRFFLKSVGWVGIYLLGYYNLSIAWLLTPLLLTVLRSQWKSERNQKLSAAREAALADEKTMIESRIRVEDLPSWVFFPDKERAEWINSILQQMWPNVGHYTRSLINETIEPLVKDALASYGFGGFKFDKVVLGRVPPRITGIKVYKENTDRKEIIMDLDLVFASDCDIKFSVKKITAKLSDFSLRGLVRVVFKPLIKTIPLIGGVQVYFLTPPEIDFDLGGVANVLDAPGLSNVIRKIVLEQLGYFMVLPNKFTMALTDDITNYELKCPDSAGVLRVQLIKADSLMKKDIGVMGLGKSDPYAVLQVGAKTVKTKVISNTVSPEWFFTADFPIEVVEGQELTVEVYDHDDPGDDEFLGRASMSTATVSERGEIQADWAQLEDVESGKIFWALSWLPATLNKSFLQDDVDDGLAKCLLHVYVDSCQDLKAPKTTKSSSKPSPEVELKVGNGEPQSTYQQHYDEDPAFEQGFVFTVVNPHSDDLHVKVIDKGHKDAVIGTATIRTSDIMAADNMEYVLQPIPLKNAGTGGGSTIKMAVSVRCLMRPEKKASSTKLTDAIRKQSEATKNTKTNAAETEQNPKVLDRKVSEAPSIAEVIADSIDPIAKIAGYEGNDVEEMIDKGQLRKRNLPNFGPGKVKLSVQFNPNQESLMITVHEAKGLPGGDLPDPPDPYVKMYLLPNREKKSKRKTDAKKDTVTPIFDENFEYENLPIAKLQQNLQLEVTVVDRKGTFSRRAVMGRAIIELSEIPQKRIDNQWFDLTEVDEDSD